MTVFKNFLLPFVLGVFVVIISFPLVSKADFWGGGKTWDGHARVEYTPSVASYGYTNIYNAAVNNWRGLSSKVTITVGVGSHPNDDKYHVAETSTPNLLGRIVPYNGSEVGSTNYWAYVRVYIYDNTFNNFRFDEDERIGTATHEIGHSLKLAHPLSKSVSAVMHQYDDRDGVVSPTSYDISELRRKWGN